MNKKKFGILICLSVALLGITTMTGCGTQNTEPTEPKIKTTIDPKNWARVEDYADYPTEEIVEPTEGEQEPIAPETTEPVVEETEPVTTEPAPTEPPVVLYNVAKDNSKRYFLASDLGELSIAGEKVNLLTLNVSDLEAMGFVKGEAEQNSGVNSQYLFDGFAYTKDTLILYVDADENGTIRGVKIADVGIAVLGDAVAVDVALNNFYDALEAAADAETSISRMNPAAGRKNYEHAASLGYRAVFTCTTDGVTEIAIFTEDYVNTWGSISN